MSILGFADYFDTLADMRLLSQLPIIADCESGFGGERQVREVVRRLRLLGIDGISLEDNRYPKVCSLYRMPARELEQPEVHAVKIRAACAATGTAKQDMLVLARTEALVAGLGVGEALSRSRAYAEAGADAIIVQTTDADGVELLEFGAKWDLAVPLVAIPTTYSQIPADELARHGFGIVIYANQAIRTAATAMRGVLARVVQERRLQPGDPCMASINDMMKLTETRKERP